MLHPREFITFTIGAAALLAPLALHAEEAAAPLKGGYSIAFPEKPEQKEVVPSSSAKTTLYSVNRSDAAFLAGYTEYVQNVDLGFELQADIDSFVKSLGASLKDQKRTDFIGSDGGRLPRIDFSFESEKAAGRGLAIVTSPRTVVMVSALSLKPNGLQQVDRFVDSFKLTQ